MHTQKWICIRRCYTNRIWNLFHIEVLLPKANIGIRKLSHSSDDLKKKIVKKKFVKTKVRFFYLDENKPLELHGQDKYIHTDLC